MRATQRSTRSSSTRSAAAGSKMRQVLPSSAAACVHSLARASTWPMLAIFSPTCTPPMLTVTVAERAPMLKTCAA
ncbi:hypothetical protein G6F68_016190 [Rhizopus microsporus]|nr:hypothetical protein G6F24_018819 [Rhizopus arrhizus]KAG1242440.1 hypothetical protein G6F68_016190 [Rhizopus microsporus]